VRFKVGDSAAEPASESAVAEPVAQ
jgi:hypothetical protein